MFYYNTFLLLLVSLLSSEVKGEGGGDENDSGYSEHVNRRGICTTTCISVTLVILSVFITGISGFLCTYKAYKKKHNTEKSQRNYQNTTDGGESGINNNNNSVNSGVYNDSYSLPPSYESTNPAPDPPYEFGKKNDATVSSLNDARDFSRRYPPNENLPTPEEIENIIIQDGYNAWKFVPEDVIIKAKRASISNDGRKIQFYKKRKGEFKYDDIRIQTNYPFFIPDFHAVNSEEIELDIMHYFEITLQSKSKDTVAIGITTKPYPYFRLPGWNINSVGYHSDDGRKFLNDEFGGRDYGPEWGKLGDVIGCGYKPKTGEVFFTKNGNFLGIAFAGLRHTWYPTIGSDGDIKMKVNFGDELFVYKDARGFGIGTPSR